MQIPIASSLQPGGESTVTAGPPRRARWRSERYLLGYILGISLALQLLVAPYLGFYGDLQAYLAWGAAFDGHPLLLYSLTPSNYPPLTIYLFGVVDLLYYGIGHLVGFSNAQLSGSMSHPFAVLWFMAKWPMIAANLGSCWLIYRLARHATSARFALLATLAYAVAPSMILDGAIWGQTDGVPIFFLLLALVAVQARRPLQLGALLALAVLIKPQPVIFIPLVLWYVLLTAGWRDVLKASVAGLVTILLICSPFLVPPHLQMLAYLQNTTQGFGSIFNYALNLWFLLGSTSLHGSWTYQTPVIGALTLNSVGVLLFAPVYALALALVWRRRSVATLYMAMALSAVGFFDLTALQRERYLFPALAFLLLAAVYHRSFLLHYALASMTVFTNILLVAAFAGVYVAQESQFLPLYQFFLHHPQILVLTALLNMALLLGVSFSALAWLRDPTRGLHAPATQPDNPPSIGSLFPVELSGGETGTAVLVPSRQPARVDDTRAYE
jgi:dolichyl-phosphate-mannose-protein mannosyltransferase